MLKKLAIVAATSVALINLPMVAHSQPKSCPPGLAKRDNGCMPPGLAKRYTVGETLPDNVEYQLITDLLKYGLNSPDGDWLYYLVDGDILKIADATFAVLDAWEALNN